MSIYTDDLRPVNVEVDQVEIPAFLPRRKQAAVARKRRGISPETWGSLRAAIAKEQQALPPDSPRVRPTLPRLRWLEKGAA